MTADNIVRLNTQTHRHSLAASCLMCLILSFVISPAIADPQSTPTDANNREPNKPNGADWLIAKTPKTDLARNIWRERMTAPQNQKENKTKEQLQQLIKRIRAIEFNSPDSEHKSVAAASPTAIGVEPIAQIEPNPAEAAPPDQNLTDVRQMQAAPSKTQPATIAQETLSILAERLQKPELIKNPFELGEILSNAGYPKEAAVCYSQALTRIDPNLPDPTGKKPWILLQLGNCLRKDDPKNALEAYSRLINEHAGSLWTDLAKAQSSLITWYQQEKPKTLIEQSRPKPPDDPRPLALISTAESKAKTEPQKGE
ncbi:MAG: hypothetical protein JXN61_11090 [Sedimentisphaerales bacterium]|nr:hypothetical protein [Sedimentisphaerales bacterium]